MAQSKLSKLELQILEALWAQGKASIREIQEAFPEPRPAYTTIQTTVYRLEGKNAVRRVRKISNAHIFEPTIARDVTRHVANDQANDLVVDATGMRIDRVANALVDLRRHETAAADRRQIDERARGRQ